MDFMTKMEEKIFEKFDSELSAKKDIEAKIAQYLEEKFNMMWADLQNQSKIKYDAVENLGKYFEKELPKIQSGFKIKRSQITNFSNSKDIRIRRIKTRTRFYRFYGLYD